MATNRVTAFELVGADGHPIHGNVHTAGRVGEARPTVVICHGFKGFKDWGFFPTLADRLSVAGLTAVRFNFSGAGVSDGDRFDQPERFGHDTFTNQLADLRGVVDWTGAARVGLMGHSRGGGVAVLQAASDPRVAALVTWAAIAAAIGWDQETLRRWRAEGFLEVVNQRTGEVLPLYVDLLNDFERHRSGLDIEAAAGRLSIPWLIVHGSADESVPEEEAHRLAASVRSEGSELLVVHGAGHTFGARHPWGGTTPHLEQVLDATVQWFARHLA